jgi:toxin YoeB
MAERTVIWTKTADIQLVGILEYWVKRNKSTTYSKKLIRLVAAQTKQIAKSPHLCRVTDFPEVRVAPMGHFSIYYKITDTSIIISAFWDNRQNPKKLLEILEKNQKNH